MNKDILPGSFKTNYFSTFEEMLFLASALAAGYAGHIYLGVKYHVYPFSIISNADFFFEGIVYTSIFALIPVLYRFCFMSVYLSWEGVDQNTIKINRIMLGILSFINFSIGILFWVLDVLFRIKFDISQPGFNEEFVYNVYISQLFSGSLIVISIVLFSILVICLVTSFKGREISNFHTLHIFVLSLLYPIFFLLVFNVFQIIANNAYDVSTDLIAAVRGYKS